MRDKKDPKDLADKLFTILLHCGFIYRLEPFEIKANGFKIDESEDTCVYSPRSANE